MSSMLLLFTEPDDECQRAKWIIVSRVCHRRFLGLCAPKAFKGESRVIFNCAEQNFIWIAETEVESEWVK